MRRPRISDEERRTRVAARHRLGGTASTPEMAMTAPVAFHSSDPITPFLGARARMAGFQPADLDHLLYVERKLARVHAMRRTLFLVPTDALAILDAAVGREVAKRERRQLERWLAAEMGPREGAALLGRVEIEVIERLGDGAEWRTRDLAEAVPELATEITLGSGKWTTRSPVSSRVLFLLALDGRIVRAAPAGSWRSSQYLWAAAERWLPVSAEAVEPAAARIALIERYLRACGPATETDIRWWTGLGVRHTRVALDAIGAIEVELGDHTTGDPPTGFVLPSDLEPEPPLDPRPSFLPGLDPTPMSWKERDWYLGPHADLLFDRNGNVGPTVWLGGRIVGGWAQRPDGTVAYRLLEVIGGDEARLIRDEASSLERWLEGTTVTPRFRTPLERELASSGTA